MRSVRCGTKWFELSMSRRFLTRTKCSAGLRPRLPQALARNSSTVIFSFKLTVAVCYFCVKKNSITNRPTTEIQKCFPNFPPKDGVTCPSGKFTLNCLSPSWWWLCCDDAAATDCDLRELSEFDRDNAGAATARLLVAPRPARRLLSSDGLRAQM